MAILVVAGLPLATTLFPLGVPADTGTRGASPGENGAGDALSASPPTTPPAAGPPSHTAPDALANERAPLAMNPDKLDALERFLVQTSATLGTPVTRPTLTHPIPPLLPLRAAIVDWVLVSGASVDPTDLATQLARADALPADLQHDLAVILFAAADATLLQRGALAALSQDDITFLASHPDAITAFARDPANLGETTSRVSELAAKVDRAKSLEAALLVLEAVRETRAPLSADAARFLAEIPTPPPPGADASTTHLPAPGPAALLSMLAKLRGASGKTDVEKLHIAGDLLVAIAQIPDPRPYTPTLSQTHPLAGALETLLSASGIPVARADLLDSLTRAEGLPLDLQRALALPLVARADAIRGERIALLHPNESSLRVSQNRALVLTLSALEESLPTLEKYSTAWEGTADPLRSSLWAPANGISWATRTLNAVTRQPASVEAALAATGHALGVDAAPMSLHEDWTVEQALASYYQARNLTLSDDALRATAAKAHELPPELQTAAAILLAATADASRARDRAFASLTPADVAFLLTNEGRIDAILVKPSPTSDELSILARLNAIGARVDKQELLAAALTAAAGADRAREILSAAKPGAASEPLVTASVATDPVASLLGRVSGWFESLLPFGLASAQQSSDPVPCIAPATGTNDEVFRDPIGVLLITSCGSSVVDSNAPQNAALAVDIDLGGNDAYSGPTGATNETAFGNNLRPPVSVLLEMGGDDTYTGVDRAQGAGVLGVGILLDVAGNDDYEARERSQGYALEGVGALVDLAGNDRYFAVNASQGRAGKVTTGLSLGLLLDESGDDTYHSTTGEGYATGGFFFDLGGVDSYSPDANPLGLDLRSPLDLGQEPAKVDSERRDNAVWLDGPTVDREGLGADVEVSTKDTDKDGYPDLIETLAGSDPNNHGNHPTDALNNTVNLTLLDSDRDGYPDTVEALFGTDPHNASSYPLGLPRKPIFDDPTGGFLRGLVDFAYGNGNGTPTSSDKILDLRVPLSDGGRFAYAQTCDEPLWVFMPGDSHPTDVGKPAGLDGEIPIVSGTCPDNTLGNKQIYNFDQLAFHPWAGNITFGGDALVSRSDTYGPGDGKSATTTLTVPTGILAIGDIVPTTYTADYLATIDLGGTDHYDDAAGGAGLVKWHNDVAGTSQTSAGTTGFTLPIGLLTVDVSAPLLAANGGADDTYIAPKGAPAQGALGGILLDTSGNDRYIAGAGSQGANGGLLLDLAGDDRYAGGDGSQGAAMTTAISPANLTDNVGAPPTTATSDVETARAAFARSARALTPSLLLDFNGNDVHTAGNESQGFAVALLTPEEVQNEASTTNNLGLYPENYGILADLNGTDLYDTASSHGRFSQGVGWRGGVGILADIASESADVAGGQADDTYRAFGAVSQGAAVPGGVSRPEASKQSSFPPAFENVGGLGVLLDLAGHDHYRYVNDAGARDRTVERQDRVTTRTYPADMDLTPGTFVPTCPVNGPSSNQRNYCLALTTGLGVHADLESATMSDENGWPMLLDSLAGTGGTPAIGEPASNPAAVSAKDAFLVNLPTAGLGIGGTNDTAWKSDYAVAIDLGGNDTFTNNAGGPVLSIPLGNVTGVGYQQASQQFALTEFPVTFVDEVGSGDTHYVTSRDLAQGVGAFTVGLLIDGGGEDTMTVVPHENPALASRHVVEPPVLDGVIGGVEWGNAKHYDLILNGENDTSDVRNVSMNVMNDDQYAYLSFRANWTGAPLSARAQNLSVHFAKDDNDFAALRGAFDTIFQCHKSDTGTAPQRDDSFHFIPQLVGYTFGPAARGGGDRVQDTYFNDVLDGEKQVGVSTSAWVPDCKSGIYSHQDVKGMRRFANGAWSYETRVPLSDGDPLDLAIRSGTFGGFENPTVGFQVELNDPTTGETYRYPQGSAGSDGEAGFPHDSNMTDEVRSWASLTFASKDDPASTSVPPPNHRPHVLTDAAAVAGIGIVAMLGETESNGVYKAEDLSFGFGAPDGLAVWFDAGGSDRYVSGENSQGAAFAGGSAYFIDLQGDDAYVAGDHSQGFSPGQMTVHQVKQPRKDTWTDEANPKAVHGDDAVLEVGGNNSSATGGPGRKDLWLGFDISDIPGSATFTGARLLLAGRSDPPAARTLNVSSYKNPFDESTLSWDSALQHGKYDGVNFSSIKNAVRVRSVADGTTTLFADSTALATALTNARGNNQAYLNLHLTDTDQAVGPTLLFDSRETFPGDRYELVLDYQAGGTGITNGVALPVNAASLSNALFLDAGGNDTYSYTQEDARNLTATFLGRPTSSPLNDRAWQQGAGVGLDYEVITTAQDAVRQLGLDTGAGTTVPHLAVNVEEATAPDCAHRSAAPLEGGIARLSGTVCVTAFAYYPSSAVDAYGGMQSLLPWERLDILVNSRLLGVVPSGTRMNASAAGFAAIINDSTAQGALYGPFAWDTTKTPDGVEQLLARVYGRSSQGDASLFRKDSQVRALVDNPPTVALALDPPYGAKGIAAAFGPQAVTHDGELTLSLTPSRDAAEDRLPLAGLTPEARAVYCDSGSKPIPTRPLDSNRALCDAYPFYIDVHSKVASNSPPSGAGALSLIPCNPATCGEAQVGPGDGSCVSGAKPTCLEETITAPATMDMKRLVLYLSRTAPEEADYTTRVKLTHDSAVFVKTTPPVHRLADPPQACGPTANQDLPSNVCAPPCSSANTFPAFTASCGTLTSLTCAGLPVPALPMVPFTGIPSVSTVPCQTLRGGLDQDPTNWAYISIDVPANLSHYTASDTLTIDVATSWTGPLDTTLGAAVGVCHTAFETAQGSVVEPAADDAIDPAAEVYHGGLTAVDQKLSNVNQSYQGRSFLLGTYGTVKGQEGYVRDFLPSNEKNVCEQSISGSESLTYTDGLATNLSRIQVFVPTEPSTHLGVSATPTSGGDAVTIPIAGKNGDAFEGGLPFVFPWNGNGAADGLYRLAVDAFTPANGQHGSTSANVLLDATPPTTVITTPAFVGAASLTDDNQILLRWNADDGPVGVGSGIRIVRLWEALGSDVVPPASAFFPVNDSGGHSDFPSNVHEIGVPKLSSANNYYFVALAEDGVGNVEHLTESARSAISGCPPGHLFERPAGTALIARCRTAAFDAAFQDAIATGDVASVRVDVTPPVVTDGLLSGNGTRVVSLDGETVTDVRAGAPAHFHVCAADLGGDATGIAAVKVFFVLVPAKPGDPIVDRTETMTSDGAGCYDYTGWASVDTDKTDFPDGRWNVGFEAFDAAANKGEFDLGDVILDSVAPSLGAPVLTALSPDCAPLPAPQQALKPGDCFQVNVTVSELFGIDEGNKTVLHAGALDKAGNAQFHPVPGTNDTWAALAVVDKSGLTSQVYELPIDIPDLAGNVAHAQVAVPVDLHDFALDASSVYVTNITYDTAVVHWRTDEPTTSRVNWGVAPTEFAMKRFSALDANLTKEHTVLVTGLPPSTRIFFRAVSSSVSGLVHLAPADATEAADFTTLSALFLDPISPKTGDAVSGVATVNFTGGLHVPGSPVRFDVDLDGDFFTSTTASDLHHAIAFNTTRYLDGNHTLTVSATSGKDQIDAKLGPFLIDNTPPDVVVTSPTSSSRDASPTFDAHATDALSGVDAASVSLTIDGVPVPHADLLLTREGRALDIHYDAAPLTLGAHRADLVVADRAGSTRRVAIPFTIDTAPPEIGAIVVSYTPGPTAAKDGARVTLNVSAEDALGGVAGARANVTGLTRGDALVELQRLAGTSFYVGSFTLAAPASDGTVDVPIDVADVAGNVAHAFAHVVVDTTPPVVTDAGFTDIGYRIARFVGDANEPVAVSVAWSAPGDHGSAAKTSLSMHPTLALNGLFPSRTYSWSATISDRAGNVVERAGHFDTIADTHAPDGVLGLRGADLHDGRIVLTWLPAKDDVGVQLYRVYRGTSVGDLALLSETPNVTFTDTGLPLENTFTYAVSAVDFGGNEGLKSAPLTIASTAPPVLSVGDVSPTIGTSATDFTFTVRYVSLGGVDPVYVRVLLDGAPYEMTRQSGTSSKEGLVYAYTARIAPTTLDKQHHYRFEANDGRYTVTFPKDAPLSGPLVSGDVNASITSGLVAFMKRLPFEGVVGMLAIIAVAALGVYVVRRRRGF